MVPSSIVILSSIRRAKRTRRRAETLLRRRQRDAEHRLLLLLLLLCLSRLSSLSSSSLWCCLLSFDWKRLVYPNPKEEEAKTWAFFVATKKVYSFSDVFRGRESKETSLSLSLFLFSLSFSHLLVFLSSPSSIVSLSLFFKSFFCLCSLFCSTL